MGGLADEFFLDQKLWSRAAVVSERYWATNASITESCRTGFGCGKDIWGIQTCGCTSHSPAIQARLVKHRCRQRCARAADGRWGVRTRSQQVDAVRAVPADTPGTDTPTRDAAMEAIFRALKLKLV